MKGDALQRWKAYSTLVLITGLEVVRRLFCKPKEAWQLLKIIGDLFNAENRSKAQIYLLENIGFPLYRMKCRLKLGRPSPKVFERMSPILESFADYPGPDVVHRMSSVKILLIRDGAMGDVLMATPVVRELYQRRPSGVVIDFATKVGAVFFNNPYVNQVIPVRELGRRTRDYDLVVDLNGVYERSPTEHPVDAYARVALGQVDFDKKLELFPSTEDIERIKGVISSIGERFLVIHCPDHDWPNRRIPREVWQKMMVQIASQTGWALIQVGTKGDLSIADCKGMPNHVGHYSIHELSVLIGSSLGFIGVDAGPAHIASTTNAPMCVFYTCAHHSMRKPLRREGRFLPLIPEIDCYGCLTGHPLPRTGYYCKRGDNACVDSFPIEKTASLICHFLRA